MKKLCCLLSAVLLAGSINLPATVSAENNIYKEFYVSAQNGNDSNAGTKSAPFKTLTAAQNAVRTVNKSMTGDIVVNILPGEYVQTETLDFFNEDSGFNGHRVIWRGSGEEKPVISGGERVSGFTAYGSDGIYVADYDADAVMQLSVNNKLRHVAKSASLITGVKRPDKYMTDEWFEANPGDMKDLTHKKYQYIYYNPETKYTADGLYISKRDFAEYKNLQDVLLSWNHNFVDRIVPVHSMETDPDRSDVWRITMKPGNYDSYYTGDIVQEFGINPERGFMVMNALELLDEPGEFYYDRKDKKLYYMPYPDEDMATAEVVAPVLDTLLSLEGNDVNDKLKNVSFENIEFSDAKCIYIDGISTGQAVQSVANGFAKGTPSGIYVAYTDGVEFKNNLIHSMGGHGLQLMNAVSNSTVVGNTFYDVGDNGLTVGATGHTDMGLNFTFKYDTNPELFPQEQRDTVSEPVPAEYKDAPYDLMADRRTKLWYSYYEGTFDAFVKDWIDKAKDASILSGLAYCPTPQRGGWGTTTVYDNTSQMGPNANETYVGTFDKYVYSYERVDKHYDWFANWRDDYSVTEGKIPYLKWEFSRPYDLDEITIAFNKDLRKHADEFSDFEVLVSNDFDFADYKVVHTQIGEVENEVNHYSVEGIEKYKFLMIRKTKPGNLACSRVWIGTMDKKPNVKNQRCDGLTIENNYFERIGSSFFGRAIGLSIINADNVELNHNELKEIAYTGISVGYSWTTDNETCENINARYNYTNDTAFAGYDGGGIYTLGRQPNSFYEYNHAENSNIGKIGFYTDNGSRFMTMQKNYVEGSAIAGGPRGGWAMTNGMPENTFKNNFATTNVYQNAGADDQFYYENPAHVPIGQPSREAYDTYTNAGLEDEYKHISLQVPESVFKPYHQAAWDKASFEYEIDYEVPTFKTGLSSQLSATISDAKFGTGLGMYPTEYKTKLSKMSSYLTSENQPHFPTRYSLVNQFVAELKASMRRYSFEDTLALCKDTLEKAKGGTEYKKTDITAFQKVVQNADEKLAKGISAEEEYDLLIALENAYNTFMGNRNSAEIVNVSVPSAEFVEIDNENLTVTAFFPAEASMKIENVEITTNESSSIARVMPTQIDFSKGLMVPVYCSSNKKYNHWNLVGEYVSYSEAQYPSDTDWIVNYNEDRYITKLANSTLLKASSFAYMSRNRGINSSQIFDIKPVSPNGASEFTLILGANNSDGFDFGNKGKEYNHAQVEFSGDEAKFYKFSDGAKTQIGETAKSGIKWNERNTLKYTMEYINENTYFTVELNGQRILSEVIEKCSYGDFAGIYTPYINIRLYDHMNIQTSWQEFDGTNATANTNIQKKKTIG